MDLFVIQANQEYEKANHFFLWKSMAQLFKGDDFLILNIPADQIVSRIKSKKERIVNAKKGVKQIADNLYVARMLFFCRPEVLPPCFYNRIGHNFVKKINDFFDTSKYENVFFIAYDAIWIRIISKAKGKFILSYYLFDEVRLNADTDKINRKRFKNDLIACRKASIIFAMSKGLAETRKKLNKNIIFTGNGSFYQNISKTIARDNRSVAFIGNFRNWIDKNLMLSLVQKRKDLRFCIIGNIEEDMKSFLNSLLLQKNVEYLGAVTKDNIQDVYRKFACVIVPYHQNKFIYYSRPIKIVESIFCGTPVVTVPVSGYEENDFIKFGRNADEFSDGINFFLRKGIDLKSDSYLNFLEDNSWDRIATKIVISLKEVAKKH